MDGPASLEPPINASFIDWQCHIWKPWSKLCSHQAANESNVCLKICFQLLSEMTDALVWQFQNWTWAHHCVWMKLHQNWNKNRQTKTKLFSHQFWNALTKKNPTTCLQALNSKFLKRWCHIMARLTSRVTNGWEDCHHSTDALKNPGRWSFFSMPDPLPFWLPMELVWNTWRLSGFWNVLTEKNPTTCLQALNSKCLKRQHHIMARMTNGWEGCHDTDASN